MTNLAILYLDTQTDIHVEIDVTISYYQPFTKGLYAGCMEDSYPDEPAEVEFLVLTSGYEFLEDDDDFTDLVLDKMQEVCEDD